MGIVNFDQVLLIDGFWKDRYLLNAEVSIPSIQKRFEDSRIKALMFGFSKDEINFHHVGYDSDVAKLMEAMAYLLKKDRNKYKDYETFCDKIIDSIASHQREDGYFNSYFLTKNEDEIFTKRQAHELYCLGHLIECAIAYDDATGKDKLLSICDKYIDYVNKRFIVDKDTPFLTPGHEEIELALIRLYEYTKKEKYYKIAEFFIENRGNNDVDNADFYGSHAYVQEDEPIRKYRSLRGHCVRALYYLDGVAKYNLYKNDEDILTSLKLLYKDLLTKQYITGGIGSCRLGEILTIPYDTPNISAYNESCAAISEMFFLKDLFALDQNKEYHDNLERILYNGFLSSTSLSGKAFFYENPLEIRLKDRGKENSVPFDWRYQLPITQRVELFDCSCCPPNIARFVASIGGYIYFTKNDSIYINQFISSKVSLENADIEILSSYPKDFKMVINVDAHKDVELLIRVPDYADKVLLDNKEVKANCQGYLALNLSIGKSSFEITFISEPKLVEANANNPFDQNKVALMYGPIVYAIEAIDNGEELNALFLNGLKVLQTNFDIQYGMNTFTLDGIRKLPSEKAYSSSYEYTRQDIKFIPYYCFANRGETDMIVWVNKKERMEL